MNKVIELIRVSTGGQAGGDAGAASQHAVNKRTAKIYGLKIVRTIQLLNVSGAAILRTPEMQNLLQLIRRPDISGVVVREFSRIMRPDCFGDYMLFHVFQESETILYLPEGPIDFNTRPGRLAGAVRAAMAGLERSDLTERLWMARETLRKLGKSASGSNCLPYGVGYDKARGWYYKPEVDHVKRAFRMFLSGQANCHRIGETSGLVPQRVASMLRNPIYCGWRVITKRHDPSPSAFRTDGDGRTASRRRIMRKPDEIIKVKVLGSPLVSEKDFDLVQQLLKLQIRRPTKYPRNMNSARLFNGFLRCGRCGSRLHYRERENTYECGNHRQKQGCNAPICGGMTVEREIETLFSAHMADSRFLRKILATWYGDATCSTGQQHGIELEAELQLLEQKLQRVQRLRNERIISSKERNGRMAAIFREINLRTEMLLSQPADERPSIEWLQSLFAPLSAWKKLLRTEQQRCLLLMFAAIHMNNHQIVGISMLTNQRVQGSRSVFIRPSITSFANVQRVSVVHIRLGREQGQSTL